MEEMKKEQELNKEEAQIDQDVLDEVLAFWCVILTVVYLEVCPVPPFATGVTSAIPANLFFSAVV